MLFYVSDETSVERCKESLISGSAITIYGVTLDHKIEEFVGVVQSVIEDKLTTGSKRWRITMREAPQTEK